MTEDNYKELYSLSNQFIEIFISDLFSKHKVKVDDIKANLSDKQRENLKETVEQLQAQVEDFLHKKDTKKTITEKDKPSLSPLKNKLQSKNSVETESDEPEV